MKNTAARTFSPEQIAYMTAKAAMEVVKAQPARNDQEYWQAFDLLVKAEMSLFSWAKNEISTNPKTAAKFGQVAVVFEKAPRNPKFRPQLVDLCMRFDAVA